MARAKTIIASGTVVIKWSEIRTIALGPIHGQSNKPMRIVRLVQMLFMIGPAVNNSINGLLGIQRENGRLPLNPHIYPIPAPKQATAMMVGILSNCSMCSCYLNSLPPTPVTYMKIYLHVVCVESTQIMNISLFLYVLRVSLYLGIGCWNQLCK